jgi:hypothetical protein
MMSIETIHGSRKLFGSAGCEEGGRISEKKLASIIR